MLFVVYAFVLAIIGACLYAVFVCGRILFFNDFRYIKDEDGSALENRQAGKYKFAALYGVSGLSGIALLFYEVLNHLPLGRWALVFSGSAAVFSGARWFVIRSHKKATSKAL